MVLAKYALNAVLQQDVVDYTVARLIFPTHSKRLCWEALADTLDFTQYIKLHVSQH
jgi:hypothetical protein